MAKVKSSQWSTCSGILVSQIIFGMNMNGPNPFIPGLVVPESRWRAMASANNAFNGHSFHILPASKVTFRPPCFKGIACRGSFNRFAI